MIQSASKKINTIQNYFSLSDFIEENLHMRSLNDFIYLGLDHSKLTVPKLNTIALMDLTVSSFLMKNFKLIQL